MYDSQVRTVPKSDEKTLIFERKILRRIFGPVKEGEVWRKMKNKELYELFGEADVVSIIKLLRLRWAGHVVRISEGEGKIQLFKGAIGSSRSLGQN